MYILIIEKKHFTFSPYFSFFFFSFLGNNDRGSGKLFSVELLDKEGGEIKATMFNEDVDKYSVCFLLFLSISLSHFSLFLFFFFIFFYFFYFFLHF